MCNVNYCRGLFTNEIILISVNLFYFDNEVGAGGNDYKVSITFSVQMLQYRIVTFNAIVKAQMISLYEQACNTLSFLHCIVEGLIIGRYLLTRTSEIFMILP